MGNFKNKLKERFSTIPNDLLYDGNLSVGARLTYTIMASKPEGWSFFQKSLAKEIKCNVETLARYIEELVKFGWLIKEEQERANGKFGAVKYTLLESPNEDIHRTGNLPIRENTDTVNYRNGKIPHQNNTYIESNTKVEEIKKEEKKENIKRSQYSDDFEAAWLAYKRKGNKKDAYIQWQKLTDEEKEAAAIHIPFYVRSREIQYLKDFQRYLSHHQFEEVVRGEKGEDMFDPSRTTAGEYNPDNSLHSDVGFGWDFGYVCKNEHRDPYKDMIFDGYTNDTRPDGALLYFKNGLRYHRWNAQAKVWRKVEGHWDREKRMFIEEGQQ